LLRGVARTQSVIWQEARPAPREPGTANRSPIAEAWESSPEVNGHYGSTARVRVSAWYGWARLRGGFRFARVTALVQFPRRAHPRSSEPQRGSFGFRTGRVERHQLFAHKHDPLGSALLYPNHGTPPTTRPPEDVAPPDSPVSGGATRYLVVGPGSVRTGDETEPSPTEASYPRAAERNRASTVQASVEPQCCTFGQVGGDVTHLLFARSRTKYAGLVVRQRDHAGILRGEAVRCESSVANTNVPTAALRSTSRLQTFRVSFSAAAVGSRTCASSS
jgi:hypothetical protein